MKNSLVRVGTHLISIDHVASAHWEADRLYLHLAGGRWETLSGANANVLWGLLEDRVIFDTATGEVKEPQQ